MKKEFCLTYVLTTYNKLPYLKVVLQKLIDNCAGDEEIIIIDGLSTDGTKEYLEELYYKGKIHQFLSEKDYGEAHGYNKGLLLANGELIKLISDDDVFYYPLIRESRNFMLLNKEFDILGGDMAYIDIKNFAGEVSEKLDEPAFLDYKQNKTPFWFNGQPLMIRKSSLSILGLLSTSMKTVDTEFSLRTTFNEKVKLCWLSSFVSVRIDNPNSNFNKFSEEIVNQTSRLLAFYAKTSLVGRTRITLFQKATLIIKTSLTYKVLCRSYKYLASLTFVKQGAITEVNFVNENHTFQEISFQEAYLKLEIWLENKHKETPIKILI